MANDIDRLATALRRARQAYKSLASPESGKGTSDRWTNNPVRIEIDAALNLAHFAQDDISGIHSCSFYCDRPECVKRQRDELVRRYVEGTELAQAQDGDAKDAARLDWLESQIRHYGDGYTEPREAVIAWCGWQQSKDQQYFPGLRAAIDAAMESAPPPQQEAQS